jgi:hypothetical protein
LFGLFINLFVFEAVLFYLPILIAFVFLYVLFTRWSSENDVSLATFP